VTVFVFVVDGGSEVDGGSGMGEGY